MANYVKQHKLTFHLKLTAKQFLEAKIEKKYLILF